MFCVCVWIGEVIASRNKHCYLQNVRVTSITLALRHLYCSPCFRVWHTQLYCANSDVFINEKPGLERDRCWNRLLTKFYICIIYRLFSSWVICCNIGFTTYFRHSHLWFCTQFWWNAERRVLFCLGSWGRKLDSKWKIAVHHHNSLPFQVVDQSLNEEN